MSRQFLSINKVDRDSAIYLAGLIDGEGCFFVSSYIKNKGPYASRCYTPEFKISMTNEDTIAWVAEKLGVKYSHVLANPGKNHKDTYEIRMGSTQNIIELIPQILPFMITKKETAQVMLDFCSSRLINRKKFSYNKASYSPTEIGYFHKIKELNSVGIGGYLN